MFTGAGPVTKRGKCIEPRQVCRCRALLALCALIPAFSTAQDATGQSPAEGARQNAQGRDNGAPAEEAGTGHSRIEELFVIGRKTSGLRGDTATAAAEHR